MAERRIGGDVRAALVVAFVLTLIASIVNDATLGLVTTPIVFLLLVYAMTRVPIRQSMLTLMFFAFTLPNPSEGHPWGDWSPPFATAGALLLNHLNNASPLLSFASFSGMDLFLLILGVLSYVRRGGGSKLDPRERVATPKALMQLAWLSLAGTAYVMVSGLSRGGNFKMALWQLNAVMYLPLLFFLFQSCLRGPSDVRAVGRVVLAAATYKAVLATLIYIFIRLPPDPDTGSTRVVFATSHADSMLFADAIVIITMPFIERLRQKSKWLLPLLPIIVVGIICNNRRLAWVHLAIALLTIFIVTKDSPFKRKIRRSLLIATPLIAIYVMAGWNSGGGMTYKPVRILRSLLDSKSDSSTLWRDYENLNLIMTIRSNPVFGVGYGNGYDEVVQLPAISYDLERYLPHNSILGLLGYCGYFGYAMLTMLWVAGIYFAMRAYRSSPDPIVRVGAICCLSGILIYMMHCWGDLGLSSWTGVFSTAVSIALAAKLAGASNAVLTQNKTAPVTPPIVTSVRIQGR